jgi:hypothetical protein
MSWPRPFRSAITYDSRVIAKIHQDVPRISKPFDQQEVAQAMLA